MTEKGALGGIVLGAVLMGTAACGCNGAALSVRRGAWSGELELHGQVIASQYAAQDAMLAHCGGRARIVEGIEAERVAAADRATTSGEPTVDSSGPRLDYICVSQAPVEFRVHRDAPRTTASTTLASEL